MTTLQFNNPYALQWKRPLSEQADTITESYSPTRPVSSAQSPPKPQRSLSEAQVPASNTAERRDSSTVSIRTRSIGGPFGGVIFERQMDLSPPNDDEIIIATVRVTNSFRRASIEGCEDLPSRPPPRSFLRRMSTRVGGERDVNRYTAIKMPRKEYKKYFARDRNGDYAGTEPEREWSQEDLNREFAQYQEMPLRSIPGGSEYGEPARRKDSLVGQNLFKPPVISSGGVYLFPIGGR